jgi:hypothetical protein
MIVLKRAEVLPAMQVRKSRCDSSACRGGVRRSQNLRTLPGLTVSYVQSR